MAENIRSSLARYIGLMTLVPLISGACLSSAFAEQTEQGPASSNVSELSSRPIGEPLTDFETMELHYRRYSNAANNMAQLVKQLNQKIQDVSLAAKTVAAKNSSHNKRLLEDKLRQLESARTSSSNQYALLQTQMQNEYRNYTAISNNLKARYDTANGSKTTQETAKDMKAKSSAKGKDSKVKDSKAKDLKTKEPNTKDPGIKESQVRNSQTKELQIKDLGTEEVRARRDAAKDSNSSRASSPAPSPTLNMVR
ncbi:MAG: hypothetical protein ABIN99_02330 [Nitrosospira sp.]